MNVYFLLEIKASNFVTSFHLFICKKISTLTATMRCMCGRFNFSVRLLFFFCYASFNINKYKEWALVLPSSFIIHNLGRIVNSSKDSVSPKRPCWSDPVTSYKPPHAALALAIDKNPKQKPQHSPKSGLSASDQRQAAGIGGWRPDRNRGVVPERVSTMGDRMRASASTRICEILWCRVSDGWNKQPHNYL